MNPSLQELQDHADSPIHARPTFIAEQDWQELTGTADGQSAIDPRIAEMNWRTITDPEQLVKLLNLGKGSRQDIQAAELMIPGWAVRGISPSTGEKSYDGLQYKFRNPPAKLDGDGRPIPGRYTKYRSASDIPTTTLFLRHWEDHFWEHAKNDCTQWIWVTEGAKKAASLLSASLPTVALPGVWNGQKRGRLLSSFTPFLGIGRNACIVFDRDWIGNRGVAAALDHLGRLIEATGSIVHIAIPPAGVKGVDDYIASVIREGGRREQAIAVLQETALSFTEWRDLHLSGDASIFSAPEAGEILPHAVNLELEVLRSITTSNLRLPDLQGWEFYFGAHQAWWLALTHLARDGTVIDFATVAQKLRDLNKLTQMESLGSNWAQEGTLTPTVFDGYLEIIKEKAARRKALAGLGLVSASLKDPNQDIQSIAGKCQAIGYELAVGSTADSLQTFGDACVDAYGLILDRYDGKAAKELFLATHMPYFSQQLGGFERGQFAITSGRPGSGKTTMAVFQALTLALSGTPALVFSLEMSALQLVYRAISAFTGVAYRRIQMGMITELELELVMKAATQLSSIPLWIDDRPNPPVTEVASKVAQVRALTNGDLGLVVLDFVQLMKDNKTQNRAQELSFISNALRQVAKDNGVYFNCLSQLSRGVEGRKDKRPNASDLKESGSLEENASQILGVYRDLFYYPNSVLGSVGEIIVSKNRSYRTGTIPVFFDLAHFRVLDPFWINHRFGAANIRQKIEKSKTAAGEDFD